MKLNKLLTFYFLLLVVKIGSSAPVKSFDIIVSKTGKADYRTVQQAINAVKDCKSERTVIFIKNGIYNEKVIVSSAKTNITLVGESIDKTIITYDDYNPKVNASDTVTTWSSYTFAVDGEGFIAENITFENSAGRVGQAVAVRVMADKVIFRNCRMLGNQDTLFAHGIGRMWFYNCYIEGTTDFIFGSAVALFEKCQIHSKSNSYITAASTAMGCLYGFVFKECSLTADSGVNKVFLGRPWRPYAKTVYLNCTLGRHIRPEGWNNWNSTDKEKTTYYAEYNNKGDGSNTQSRVCWSKQLSDTAASEYTIPKIFARNSVPIPVVGAWVP